MTVLFFGHGLFTVKNTLIAEFIADIVNVGMLNIMPLKFAACVAVSYTPVHL